MEDRVDAVVLWARASCVGLLAFGLGVVGHVMAGGLLPGPALLAALLVGAVVLSASMLDRPASPVRLMSMMVAGQTLIHLVLAVTAGHRGDVASQSSPGVLTGPRALPVVDGRRVGSLQDVYQGMSGRPTSPSPALPIGHLINDLSAHAPMMVVHLVAAALVGLWLGFGESCLWTLLAITGRRILAAAWCATAVFGVQRPGLVAATTAGPVMSPSRWQARPQPRRGPPRFNL